MTNFFEVVSQFYPQVLFSFACSAALTWLIVRQSARTSRAYSMVSDTKAQQALHRQPTPRIGGVAVICSFALVMGVQGMRLQTDLLAPLLAASVVFIVGVKEDLYRDVSAKFRLLAAFMSAGAALYYGGGMITRLDLPGVDTMLAALGLWGVLTLVWSAGACHAFNLIDGLNGLASGYAIIASIALALIATKVGALDVVMIALTLVGAVFGFYVFNWPYGKIFLGDAGAYALGHIIAWMGIVLSARNPDVSPLALLLILFWPVADTVFTLVRRAVYGRALGQPDRFHFHHIAIRILRRLTHGKLSQTMLNSLSAVALYPIMLVPALLGVIFWNKPVHGLVALLVCVILFMSAYIVALGLLAARKLRCRKAKRAEPRPELQRAFEYSQYSGTFVGERVAVEIIIRRQDAESEWTLAASADRMPGRSWAETFKTDLDAWNAFITAVERDGIEAVVGGPSKSGRTHLENSRIH